MRSFGLQDKVVVLAVTVEHWEVRSPAVLPITGLSLAILDFELGKAITRAASFTAEKIKAIAVAEDVSKESSKRKIGWIRGIWAVLKYTQGYETPSTPK